MSVTFGFYNSRYGDRVYDATQMSSLFNGIIRDGVFANYPAQNQHLTIGIGPAVDGHPTIDIGPGRAWFNGTWTDNSSPLSLKLPAADNSQDRYDAIILEVNTTNDADNTSNLYPSTWDGGNNGRSIPGRSNAFAVLAGTPGGNYPTVSSSNGIYRYALAYVKVAHGASTVASVDYKVGTTVPYIVNAVQETWDATDLINNWNSQWSAYLDSLSGQFSTYLSDKDSAWNNYLSVKDSAWNNYLSVKNGAWNAYISDKDDAWNAFIAARSPFYATFYGIDPSHGASSDDPSCARTLTEISEAYAAGRQIVFEWQEFFDQVQDGTDEGYARSITTYTRPLTCSITEERPIRGDTTPVITSAYCAFRAGGQPLPGREIVWFRIDNDGVAGGALSPSEFFES